MQLTTVGKLKKGSLYLKNNLSEEQPVEYDKLILYLSLKSGLLSTKNYLEDVGLDKFNTYDGINTYWINMTQDGTFLGNPIYRVEKGSSDQGFFYRYNITGLEKIASYGEYILTGIFKSSNSSETICPLDQHSQGVYGPYAGGGVPWTAQNHTPGYDVIDYRFYLGNGWWRYIHIFKIDWDKISNVSYRNRFYFGFYWLWQNAGQYMWGTQPQLYIGNWKKSYQGNISSYNFSDLIKYKDSVSIEGPQTNQISISNMNSYPIGYTGNVCGFSNNFNERFGAGNWSTEIIAQDNCILPELRKAQRITTKQSGQGGWTQGNIGNTTGDITYGVLLRLHYGEIRFGDLNSSNRLYINENYYTQRGKKLGDWIWQCGTFQASGGGRHLYQYNNTKADIQQVQIYNTNYQLSYIDGSKNSSYIELPVDVFNEFKDEMTVSFIYEPLSNKTYGEDSQVCTVEDATTNLISDPTYGLIINEEGTLCTTYRDDNVPFRGVRSFAVETATTNYWNNDITDYAYQILSGDVTFENTVYNGRPALKCILTGTDPYIKVAFKHSAGNINPGDTYTASIGVAALSSEITGLVDTAAYIYFAKLTFGGFDRPDHNWGKAGNRIYATYTHPMDEVATSFYACVYFKEAGTFYLYDYQLEKKPFASSFVVGSRPKGRLVISLEDLKFDIANDDWVISYWKYPVATYDDTQNNYSTCSLGQLTSDRSKGYIWWGKETSKNKYRLSVILNDATESYSLSNTFNPADYFYHWHYEVMKKQGKVLSYYVDGVKQIEYTIPANKELQTPFDVGLGLGIASGTRPNNALIAALYCGYNSATWTDEYIREVYENPESLDHIDFDNTYIKIGSSQLDKKPYIPQLSIYRGNDLGDQDQIQFVAKDGTVVYTFDTAISGINQRLNHKLFIQMSYKEGERLQIYAKDLDTGDILKEENIALPSDFSFDKSFSYQRLGSLNLGTDQQNQKFSEFHFYHKSYDQSELQNLIPRVFQIDKVGFQKAKQIIEPHNILTKYGPTQFDSGEFGGIWGKYEQTNCSVYIVPKHFRRNQYSYYIKRKPNITGSGSETQNWGGVKLSFPDDNTWEEGQTYRLSFQYTGYSYNDVEIYFAYDINNTTMDVGLTKLDLDYITHSFTDEDGWQYYEQEFTIPEGFIHQVGTDDNTYYCMRQLKIGYGYTTTNEYGTRLYINDLKIEKISGNDSFRKTGGIKTRGIYAKEIFENNTFHDVYMVGTASAYTYPDAEQRTTGNRVLKIDNNTIYNSGGRGLRLTIFDRSFNVITDTTYDVYGDDAQRTNLANQLLQIDKENYWQLTSFDQVNPNANLTNQFAILGSTIWPLSHRSPYQAFGKGKKIIYEDGQSYNANYKTKQVLNFKI